MRKAQVLTRFMLLAIVWILLGAAAGAVIGTALVGWAGMAPVRARGRSDRAAGLGRVHA